MTDTGDTRECFLCGAKVTGFICDDCTLPVKPLINVNITFDIELLTKFHNELEETLKQQWQDEIARYLREHGRYNPPLNKDTK